MIRSILILFICLSFIGCKKKKKSLNDTFDITGATLISQSSFSSNAHTSTGCVRIYSKSGSKYLVLEGFKTDNGPDVRIYLSKSTNNNEFIDLGGLKSTLGNFNYSFDSAINTTDYKYVLVWCKDYSVLFGNALLQ